MEQKLMYKKQKEQGNKSVFGKVNETDHSSQTNQKKEGRSKLIK